MSLLIMWQRLKNFILGITTYSDLAPDMRMRRSVSRSLRDRRDLDMETWTHLYGQSLGISPKILNFAYQHLEHYSGLPVSQLRPSDRLHEDLAWVQVCWFDWQERLCDDFYHCFGFQICDRLDQARFKTLGELLQFLNRELSQHH